jgi:hypothetical protein
MTIEFFPAGYRYTSVIIAYAKRVLTMPEARFTPNEQLGALQSIAGQADANFTTGMIQAIEPACDTFMAMVDAAKSADRDVKKRTESFAILTGAEVFTSLVQLNPGLQRAVELHTARYGHQPAIVPAPEPEPAAPTPDPVGQSWAFTEPPPRLPRPKQKRQIDVFTGLPIND